MHFNDTLSSIVRIGLRPTNVHLSLAHSRVDINVLDFHIERAMLLMHEPRVSLPAKVKNKEEGAGEIVLEEDDRVEIRSANGPEGDVELGGKTEKIHDSADVRAPDSKCCSEGEFVDGMSLKFPVRAKLGSENNVTKRVGHLTMPIGSECGL